MDSILPLDENDKKKITYLYELMSRVLKPHPWHGIPLSSENSPENEYNAFIEIVPSDSVKYEMDKITGYLRVDRPQKFSNIIPALYGFIPQTIAEDGDALDILANGTKIAKGEVVMVGEKFGIRFTEVATPEELMQNL